MVKKGEWTEMVAPLDNQKINAAYSKVEGFKEEKESEREKEE